MLTENLLDLRVLRSRGRNIRLHGNRFIQIDLDDRSLERVHVWHEGLVPMAQQSPTPIHNHIFDLRSTVLAGTLVNCEFRVDACDTERVFGRELSRYHLYEGRRRHEQDTQLVRVGESAYLAQSMGALVYTRHAEYSMPALAFHASVAVGYAITHFRRSASSVVGHPHVLVPIGLSPDNVFNRYGYSEEELWDVVEMIYQQLPECIECPRAPG